MARPASRIVALVLIVLSVPAGWVRAQGRQPIADAARLVRFDRQAAAKPSDPTGNGAAIGALVGGAAMATFFVVSSKQCGPGCENDLPAWLPFFGVGVGAAAGATIGYFIDKAHHGHRKVVIAPAVSTRRKGIKVAVRF
jgi:hypothetical protein